MVKVCAGIITYNPDIARLNENIMAIDTGAICSIVIVDNGSDNISEIREIKKERSIVLIENHDNQGVAKALNQIFSYANDNSIQWVLTLDQDSVSPDNMMDEYLSFISDNESTERTILCPLIQDRNSLLSEYEKDIGIIEVKRCITSGCLTSVRCWKELNGFDEHLFIDSVDWDFCDRAIDKGFRIVKLAKVRLLHEIGQTVDQQFLFWKFPVLNHNSIRKYYRTRNLIYLAKKRGEIKIIIKNHLSVIKIVLIVLLYENEKKEKLKAICKGYKDGINSRIEDS